MMMLGAQVASVAWCRGSERGGRREPARIGGASAPEEERDKYVLAKRAWLLGVIDAAGAVTTAKSNPLDLSRQGGKGRPVRQGGWLGGCDGGKVLVSPNTEPATQPTRPTQTRPSSR